MTRLPLLLIAFAPLLGRSHEPVAPPEPPEVLYLASTYTPLRWESPLGRVHKLSVLGVIAEGHKVLLYADPNTCTVDAFGDDDRCTEIGGGSCIATLRPMRAKDPTGQGRKVFRLEHPRLEDRLTLVAPGEDSEVYRILQRSKDQKTLEQNLTLEVRAVPSHMVEVGETLDDR